MCASIIIVSSYLHSSLRNSIDFSRILGAPSSFHCQCQTEQIHRMNITIPNCIEYPQSQCDQFATVITSFPIPRLAGWLGLTCIFGYVGDHNSIQMLKRYTYLRAEDLVEHLNQLMG